MLGRGIGKTYEGGAGVEKQGGAPAVRVVEAWHEALNEGEVDRLVGLSHPDVEVGGPRGTRRGARLLREWVDRANVRLARGACSATGTPWSWSRPGGGARRSPGRRSLAIPWLRCWGERRAGYERGALR
jgi:hypothetical protein